MTTPSNSLPTRAKELYSAKLQESLERDHLHEYVAIEPDSGEHFLGDTFSEAVAKARKARTERLSFVIRIGHEAAIHLGGISN